MFALLSLGYIYRNEIQIPSILIVIFAACFLLWPGYALSHRFKIDSSKGEIREKSFGFTYRRYQINDISEYFIRGQKMDGVVNSGWIVPAGKENTLVNLKLNSQEGKILKEMIWNIDPKDADDLFSKAREINSSIIQANEPFYKNILNKSHQSKYLMVTLIVLAIAFIVAFFYILNNIT